MFLVMFHYIHDDYPVALFDDWQAARDYIASAPDQLTTEQRAILDSDSDNSLGYGIVEFYDGRPVKHTVVRWFDEEDA